MSRATCRDSCNAFRLTSSTVFFVASFVGLSVAVADQGGTGLSDSVIAHEGHLLFDAYDCSEPRGIHDTTVPRQADCRDTEDVKGQRNATYQLLQLERRQRTNGTRCSMVMTQSVRYCGVYSHQVVINKYGFTEQITPVSVEDCRRYITSLEFVDVNGRKHSLQMNAVNSIDYEEKGRTWLDDGEVYCKGEDWRRGDDIMEGVVVFRQLKLSLVHEKFSILNDRVTAYDSNRRLPCAVSSLACATPAKTFIWEPVEDECKLALTRTVTGIDVAGPTASVFMSTDQSLVRLIQRRTVSMCGRIVIATNYDRLFLYPVERGKLFERRIRPDEVSVSTFAANRDEYLYFHLASLVASEFRKVLQNDCAQAQSHSRLAFWLQHQQPGMTTLFLGNSTFGTSSGEALYIYACRPTVVRAIVSKECFRGLPVMERTIREGKEPTVAFMEPLTHRLSRVGIPMPCSTHFIPKYKNKKGTWTAAGERLEETSPPEPTEVGIDSPTGLLAENADWSHSGIYLEGDLEKAETYVDFSRTIEALGATMSGQYLEIPMGNRQIGPGQVFPSAFPNVPNWKNFLFKRVMNFLHGWGEAASILLSLYMFGRIIMFFVQTIYSCFIIRDIHACSRYLPWSFCPTAFLMKRYRKENRPVPRMPAEPIYAPPPSADDRGDSSEDLALLDQQKRFIDYTRKRLRSPTRRRLKVLSIANDSRPQLTSSQEMAPIRRSPRQTGAIPKEPTPQPPPQRQLYNNVATAAAAGPAALDQNLTDRLAALQGQGQARSLYPNVINK